MRDQTLHDDDDRRHALVVHGGVVHVTDATIVEAAPALVTEANCERHGLTRRALRKLLRAGVPSIETPDGRACVLADLLAHVRAHGAVMPAATGGKSAAAEDGATPEDRALLAQGGVRLRAVAGGRGGR